MACPASTPVSGQIISKKPSASVVPGMQTWLPISMFSIWYSTRIGLKDRFPPNSSRSCPVTTIGLSIGWPVVWSISDV